MNKLVLFVNILNYVLCDFFETIFVSLRFIYPPFWILIIARHKKWRRTERFLRWFTLGFNLKGTQRKSVRYLSMDAANSTISFYFLCLTTTPIAIYLSFITNVILDFQGHKFLLFSIWLVIIIIIVITCLEYKNRDERYIRIFERRYRKKSLEMETIHTNIFDCRNNRNDIYSVIYSPLQKILVIFVR